MRISIVLGLILVVACGPGGSAQTGDDANTIPGDGKKVYKDASLSDVGGGPLAELRFAITGDTRPPSDNDTAGYPTAIITKIWQDIQAESPRPDFAISTGDYMFASPSSGNQQMPQLALYKTARDAFSGLQYPAMGNHECTGATDSNCGAGQRDGITSNMTDFIQVMLSPLGVSTPYYTEHFTATDGTWNAKFVFIACNAWTPTQAAWLQTELALTTTYTFVVRHESVSALVNTPTPPCGASTAIINAHPMTLLVVGHTHEYRHEPGDHEVIVGNGGAPLTTGVNYGYVIVARNPSGTLTVTEYDYMTHAVLDTFNIQASGAGA